MKKRWTALLLALAMLSALAVGALADEQNKEMRPPRGDRADHAGRGRHAAL